MFGMVIGRADDFGKPLYLLKLDFLIISHLINLKYGLQILSNVKEIRREEILLKIRCFKDGGIFITKSLY